MVGWLAAGVDAESVAETDAESVAVGTEAASDAEVGTADAVSEPEAEAGAGAEAGGAEAQAWLWWCLWDFPSSKVSEVPFVQRC